MANPGLGSFEEGQARAMALDAEARQAFESGDYTRSRRLFERALAVCRSIGWKDEIFYGLLHVTQAMSFEAGYDPGIARPLLEEVLQVAQEIGTTGFLLPVQINRVRVMIDAGQHASGLNLAREHLWAAAGTGDRNLASSLLIFIAFALAGLGRAEAETEGSSLSLEEAIKFALAIGGENR